MAKFDLGRALEGTAYGVLNELLAEFRDDDGVDADEVRLQVHSCGPRVVAHEWSTRVAVVH